MCPPTQSRKAILLLGLAVSGCVPIDPALPQAGSGAAAARPETAPSPSPAPSPAATLRPVPTPSPSPPSWAERLAKGKIRTLGIPDVLLAPAGLWASAGEVWFADAGGHAVWSTDGTGLIRRIGWGAQGWSGDGGSGPEGQLAAPFAGCAWLGGHVVADYGNGRLRTLDATGRLGTVAWPGDLPMLQGPAGLAQDAGGALLVADYAGNRLFRLRTRDEGEVLAGTGAADVARPDRPAQGGTIDHPLGVLVREDGRIVVGEGGSGRLLEVGVDGTWKVVAEDLPEPSALVEDGAGGLIVASGGLHQIVHVAASGVRKVLAGEGPAGASGDGGAPPLARFVRPAGLLAWQEGLLVADLGTRNLRWIEPAP
ncbi:MAG: hypothetical protein VKP57_03025 [Candidatus Sericytochromatia bacterium]|nr:hypothetical protein [Candidatus Sericytochromatia bacterium]